MKKKLLSGMLAFSLLAAGVMPAVASAQDATSTSATSTEDTEALADLQAQIQQLIALIDQIREQIQSLGLGQQELREEIQGLRLEARELREGIRGADVELLQQILASDSSIYPEGLVTGYFGPLTKAAVVKFQAKTGINEGGEVGPKTKERINQILAEGAGNSGNVPPGLLIAPGIQKFLRADYEFVPPGLGGTPPGQQKKDNEEEEDEEEDDTTAPVISELGADASSTTATVMWATDEESDGTVWYGTSTPVVAEAPFLSVEHLDLKTAHSVELSGLSASTTYNFMVVSKDEAGNTATSTEDSFTTTGE